MSVFATGVSGLLAAQRALSVTSHNIANVNTEGYSRQRVELATRNPQQFGNDFIGNGVTVTTIQRVYDQFAVANLRTASSSASQAQQYRALADQVNNLLAASGVGVMPALQDFFDAVQGVANNPASQVERQVMISTANALAAQFRYFDSQLETMRNDSNAMLSNAVAEVNNLTSAIADINRRIADAGAGGPPNDLLDRRDELVRQLSERVAVTTVMQDDGSLNVFIGNGQAVVAGSEARAIAVVPNAHDPQYLEIAFMTSPTTPVVITSQLHGGKIGGILEFRGQILEPTQSALGQLAFGIAATFNEQHAQGMNLRGELGGDFFVSLASAGPPSTTVVLPNAGNSGRPAAVLDAVVSDAAALTGSDYRLERNGTRYTLTRLSDNQVFTLSGFPANSATVDGVTVSLAAGAIADGDSFVINPVRNAARNFGVAITDPAQIAAAGPQRSAAALDNTGSGTITMPQVFDRDAYTGQSYRIVALDSDSDGQVDSYSVFDAADNVIASGPFAAGADIEFAGMRVALGGVPYPGDSFTLVPNTGGVSDNRNILALAGLQSATLLNGGVASYQSLYSGLVGDVGNKTQQAQVNAAVQESLLNRAVESREAVSGVNLDEEAAAILRHQQAYQAAAQIITTANAMFESLIAVLRR